MRVRDTRRKYKVRTTTCMLGSMHGICCSAPATSESVGRCLFIRDFSLRVMHFESVMLQLRRCLTAPAARETTRHGGVGHCVPLSVRPAVVLQGREVYCVVRKHEKINLDQGSSSHFCCHYLWDRTHRSNAAEFSAKASVMLKTTACSLACI